MNVYSSSAHEHTSKMVVVDKSCGENYVFRHLSRLSYYILVVCSCGYIIQTRVVIAVNDDLNAKNRSDKEFLSEIKFPIKRGVCLD